jgi:hypothetical protein
MDKRFNNPSKIGAESGTKLLNSWKDLRDSSITSGLNDKPGAISRRGLVPLAVELLMTGISRLIPWNGRAEIGELIDKLNRAHAAGFGSPSLIEKAGPGTVQVHMVITDTALRSDNELPRLLQGEVKVKQGKAFLEVTHFGRTRPGRLAASRLGAPAPGGGWCLVSI